MCKVQSSWCSADLIGDLLMGEEIDLLQGRQAPSDRSRFRLFDVLWAAPFVAAIFIVTVGFLAGHGHFLNDFEGGLYNAGRDIMQGRDPYAAPLLDHQASIARAGGTPQTILYLPVYPAPVLVAMVPWSALPYPVVGIAFWLASALGLVLALRLLGVSDLRCVAIAFASWPVQHGLMLGALTPLLVLAVALLWRYREEVLAPALAASMLVVSKLFPWPLAVWLVLTRRFRAAAVCFLLGTLAVVSAWAAVGFEGFAEYPRMVRNLAYISEPQGVSMVSALRAIGLSSSVSERAALLAGAALVFGAWRLARSADGERRSFSLVVVAALVASPIVWPHYMALLLVPIALAAPRLSPLWLVPLISYIAPIDQMRGRLWTLVPYLGMITLVGWLTALRPSPGRFAEPWSPATIEIRPKTQT